MRMSESRESPQFGCENVQREEIAQIDKWDIKGEELDNSFCQNNARNYSTKGFEGVFKPFQKHASAYSFNGSELSSIVSENSPQITNQIHQNYLIISNKLLIFYTNLKVSN